MIEPKQLYGISDKDYIELLTQKGLTKALLTHIELDLQLLKANYKRLREEYLNTHYTDYNRQLEQETILIAISLIRY